MSMFTTRNGLYDRARKRLKISDGMKLFTYSFYKQRRLEVQVGGWGAHCAARCEGGCRAPLRGPAASRGTPARVLACVCRVHWRRG